MTTTGYVPSQETRKLLARLDALEGRAALLEMRTPGSSWRPIVVGQYPPEGVSVAVGYRIGASWTWYIGNVYTPYYWDNTVCESSYTHWMLLPKDLTDGPSAT